MENLLDNKRVKRIILDSGIASSEEKLKDEEFANYLKHEFRFLWNGNHFLLRERSLFTFLETSNIDLAKIKILDIGCGDCFNLFMLKKEYQANVIGVDIQKNSLVAQKIIKELFDVSLDVRLVTTELDDLSTKLDNQKFNLIFLLDLVEHLPNPRSYLVFLKEKLLQDNGYVIVLFPPYYSAYGGHYSLPYLHYLPPSLVSMIKPYPFKYRDYGLRKLTVSNFERYVKNYYNIVAKRMTFLSKINNNPMFCFISNLPLLKEVLFSWVYILQKKK